MLNKIVNKSFLGALYFNRLGEKYDVNDAKQRDAARARFGMTAKVDVETMRFAIDDYVKLCRDELEKLVPVESTEHA